MQILFLVIIGFVSRILPHLANFTPVTAISLFGATHLNKKQAFSVPFLIMILSDMFIGFDGLPSRIFVYSSFLISIFIGLWIKKNNSIKTIIFGSLLSSVIFFVVTNFGVWMFGTMYTKNLAGLAECYFYAVPFFKNAILGDLFYTGVFFGGYELSKNFFSPIKNFKFQIKN